MSRYYRRQIEFSAMKSAKYYIIIAVLILFSQGIYAGDFDRSVYDSLLSENVYDGRVDYSAIKEDPSQLARYLARLENLDSLEYEVWNDHQKIAFWINAYNAITIYGVIRNYPIKAGDLITRLIFPKNSVRQIPDFWSTAFSPVMGKDITLDEIEHGILRQRFDEPRIHFALVCASLGCPKLQSFAYKPDSLEFQLDMVTWEFLRTKGAVKNEKNNSLYVSRIFDWYGEDFDSDDIPAELMSYEDDERGFLKFIVEHSEDELGRYILENSPEIKYTEYDWSLNELKR